MGEEGEEEVVGESRDPPGQRGEEALLSPLGDPRPRRPLRIRIRESCPC